MVRHGRVSIGENSRGSTAVIEPHWSMSVSGWSLMLPVLAAEQRARMFGDPSGYPPEIARIPVFFSRASKLSVAPINASSSTRIAEVVRGLQKPPLRQSAINL
jgi:hypothetical protein